MKRSLLKPLNFRRILVATDFSPIAASILPIGKTLLAKNGRMRLLYVEQPLMTAGVGGPDFVVPVYDAKLTRRAAAAAKKHLDTIVRSLKGKKIDALVVESGKPAIAIAKEARRFKADLVCLSTHGRSAFKRLIFGSVALKLLSHYQGRVLLLRPGFGR